MHEEKTFIIYRYIYNFAFTGSKTLMLIKAILFPMLKIGQYIYIKLWVLWLDLVVFRCQCCSINKFCVCDDKILFVEAIDENIWSEVKRSATRFVIACSTFRTLNLYLVSDMMVRYFI